MDTKFKYYATNIIVRGNMLDNIKSLGYTGTHCQFRVVCKAKSFAEANRIGASLGLGDRCFSKSYTNITGNSLEIQEADKYGFILNLNRAGSARYIDVHSVV